MKFLIKEQDANEERVFRLVNQDTGENYWVDIYTDGQIEPPEGASKTEESWRAWLGTFVGKTIEIERLTPYRYFSSGKTAVLDERSEE